MNKDHKLMGGLLPIILILCIGLYGIPGALGSQSDSNHAITPVTYNGSSNTTTINKNQTDLSSEDNSQQTTSSLVNSRGYTTGSSSTGGSSTSESYADDNTNTVDTTPTPEETPEVSTPVTPETET